MKNDKTPRQREERKQLDEDRFRESIRDQPKPDVSKDVTNTRPAPFNPHRPDPPDGDDNR